MAKGQQTDEAIRESVRDRYASAARGHLQMTSTGGCCGGGGATQAAAISGAAMRAVEPITSNLYDEADTPFDQALAASLGCGNPTALAELSPGEVVLDLGSGGGIDVLLSAKRVGPTGKAYGLDMTDEMLTLAERNRAEAGIDNAHSSRAPSRTSRYRTPASTWSSPTA